jgi:signal transduction histidine kinase
MCILWQLNIVFSQPLSSLNMGIDLITAVLEEKRTILTSAPAAIKDSLLNHVCSIEENLQNMRNVNAFMLMNINRCMDYTKAMNGLKLVPHIETAPLIETIALPLHVMSAMQGTKTHIKLLPVPKDICSHIITDKQWLEENLLCLLSNAVKYSNKGSVTVSVSKAKREIDELNAQPLPSFGAASVKVKPLSIGDSSSSRENSQKTFVSRYMSRRHETPPSPKSPKPTNSVTVRQDTTSIFDTVLRIEVEDEGIGLSDEARHSLFRFVYIFCA